MPSDLRSGVRPLAAVALATAVFDLVVFAVLHIAQPGVDVVREPTSAYVHGALGFLSPVAAFVVGLGALALAVAVLLGIRGSARVRAGAILLAVFGGAKLVQTFFPIDVPGAATSSGAVHNLMGNVAFFVLPVAAVLLTSAVARATGHGEPRWWPAVAGLLLLVATVHVLAADALGWFGLAQRAYLVLAALWTALLAAWLWRWRAWSGARQ